MPVSTKSRPDSAKTGQLQLSLSSAAPVEGPAGVASAEPLQADGGGRAGGNRRRQARPATGAAGRMPRATAESLARQQRDISVAEFFAKNRHLLGFDNKRKALLTAVKEAVDNSLDACEEAGILPQVEVRIRQLDEDRFRVTVSDNGPGIVKSQIPNIFGKLLYGSKFHRLKMARGQQGIGISAAGMYGLITTGKPIRIVSRTGPRKDAHHYEVAIDTRKNHPEVILDETIDAPFDHGTSVEIELVASYSRGRQSVDEYLEQTAIANPHLHLVYHSPADGAVEFQRGTEQLPPETREIKPHPHGVELGVLLKMLKDTRTTKLGAFLKQDFSRITGRTARDIAAKAGLTDRTWIKQIGPREAEAIYQAIQKTRIMAPATNCLAPIGAENILSGLLKEIKAEFYTASTRPPAVYRGNPFQIEVGLAYGGDLPADQLARILRFANRVPLLYQQSACSMYRSVIDVNWNSYGLSQSKGALPTAPLVILIHIASVWVPFTSESKEAVADYDEIAREIRLALQECARRLALLLKRKRRKVHYTQRRDVFGRYIDEVVSAVRAIAVVDKERLRRNLLSMASQYTAQADMEFDSHGKVIRKQETALANTVVVDRSAGGGPPETLFQPGEPAVRVRPKPKRRRTRTRPKRGA